MALYKSLVLLLLAAVARPLASILARAFCLEMRFYIYLYKLFSVLGGHWVSNAADSEELLWLILSGLMLCFNICLCYNIFILYNFHMIRTQHIFQIPLAL